MYSNFELECSLLCWSFVYIAHTQQLPFSLLFPGYINYRIHQAPSRFSECNIEKLERAWGQVSYTLPSRLYSIDIQISMCSIHSTDDFRNETMCVTCVPTYAFHHSIPLTNNVTHFEVKLSCVHIYPYSASIIILSLFYTWYITHSMWLIILRYHNVYFSEYSKWRLATVIKHWQHRRCFGCPITNFSMFRGKSYCSYSLVVNDLSYAYTYTHTHMYTHIHTHAHTHTHTRTHTCTHTCMHAHTHAHTHTYTHMYNSK